MPWKTLKISLDKLYRNVLRLIMEDRRIVWDENKATENKLKHGISFEVAQYVFADPERIERLDRSENNTSGEIRWQTIGRVGKLFFVVYTERGDETRLITARVAQKPERKSYNGYYQIDGEGWTKTTQRDTKTGKEGIPGSEETPPCL
jgi:uncharacterized DUF497 family protein